MQTYTDILRRRQGWPVIDLFKFYYDLSKISTEKSGGKGYKNGIECTFTRGEIMTVLLRIKQANDTDPLKTVIDMEYLQQDGETFYLVQGALSSYNAMLRRI